MRQIFIDFPPSVATDVVGYKLYYSESPGVDFDAPSIDLGNEAPDPGTGLISVDISNVPEFNGIDGVYDLGLVAVDDSGLESTTMTVAPNVPLDFVAPDAPATISVRFS